MIKRYGVTKTQHKYYTSKGGKSDYKTYVNVISDFNLYVFDQMIYEGRILVLRDNLGKMMCSAIWRNFKYNVVNWPETNRMKKEGLIGAKDRIFFTDPFSLKIFWLKGNFKNRRYYKFQPTKGSKGNIEKLIKANKENELLYKKYLQVNKD